MKYPVVLSIDEIDTVLDALADYADEYDAEWSGMDEESYRDLRMTFAMARQTLQKREKSQAEND